MSSSRDLQLRRLSEAVAEVAKLKLEGKNAHDPDFRSWQSRVNHALSEVFGSRHVYTDRFGTLDFCLPRVQVGGHGPSWDSRDQAEFDRDFEEVKSLLRDALEEADYQSVVPHPITPATGSHAYGPGAVYDFMRGLREVLKSTTQTLLIVDPYVDDDIFDAYVSTVQTAVTVRILTGRVSSSMKSTLAAFTKQHSTRVEMRTTNAIHDRVIFVDGRDCWVLGQSIKDAAKSKPTYLAPLSQDIAQLKVSDYEAIWKASNPL